MNNDRYNGTYIENVDGHMEILDGIRGLAIILVIIVHTLTYGPASFENSTDKLLLFIFNIGWVGVDLFFVLSGFLITGILIKSKENANYFKNFYVRRSLRIFPLYYLFIIIALYVIPLFIDYYNADLYNSIKYNKIIYFLYLQNFFALSGNSLPQYVLAPLWSLAVEEHYYLFWPFIIYYLNVKNIIITSVALIVCAICLRYWMFFVHIKPNWIYKWTFTRMDSLLIGSLLAIAVRNINFREMINNYKYSLLSFLSMLSLSMFVLDNFLSGRKFYTHSIGLTIFSLGFAVLIFILISSKIDSTLARTVDNNFLKLLGKHSYAIYVIHMPLNALIWFLIYGKSDHWDKLHSLVLFITDLIASLLIAIILYHSYEKHFLKLKSRFV